VYFLRTSLSMENEETIWRCYNTIREIESSFRCLKTDLDLRPIYHKSDEATMAHLHLGILAYWLVNTVRYQLKREKITHSWREIVRIGNTQKVITTIAQKEDLQYIGKRKCSEPEPKLRAIYDALKYKQKLKFVVLKIPNPNNQNQKHQVLRH
jgi:transposase